MPFKTTADADDDADEEEPLGDDDPGSKVYKECGYFDKLHRVLEDLGELQLNDQAWEAVNEEARKKVAKLEKLKRDVMWRTEETESEFARFVPTTQQLDGGGSVHI